MRRAKKLISAAATVAGAALAVELLAAWNVRREQKSRTALGPRLYVEIDGEGDPIVFLPGLQVSTRSWRKYFDGLTGTHRTVFVDPLGFGRSPWPDVDYTLSDHLDALHRTLDAHRIDRNITFVAHSFGAVLAAYYAAQHPERVKHLYLLGTPIFDSEAQARLHLWRMSAVAALFSISPLLAREACMLICAFRPAFRFLAPSAEEQLEQEMARDSANYFWPSLRGSMRHVLLRQPITRALHSIGEKVTFIHGEHDGITGLDRISVVAKAIGARLVHSPSDHHSYIEECRGFIIDAIQRRSLAGQS